ncbi:MAG: tellurite resistance TerB family protein [Deltaproteobacteria bacterium]|nr:tellurite resistance TerB family protein [Deltaproteobacteria bacterium]
MGLLGKHLGSTPEKAPADDVLLLHSIFCMAAADGLIDDAEDELIRAYANTLPEFRDMDGGQFNNAMDASVKIAHTYDRDMKASLVVLDEIKSDAVRKKAFVLAVDVAMSSGDIDEAEEEMLAAMQRILRIDDELANKILEVISLKYQK